MQRSLSHHLRETYKFRDVVINFVSISIKIRYRRSFLGFFWTVLSPLMYYIILAVIFAYRLGAGDTKKYVVFMFSGGLAFNLMSGTINQSSMIMVHNEAFIKKIYLPKMIYVFNTIFYEGFNTFLVMTSIVVLGWLTGYVNLSFALLFLPVSLFIVLIFLTGISFFLSIAGVYFRDLGHIIPVFMNTMFFLTPILWYPEGSPQMLVNFSQINPFYYFIEIFRNPIMYGLVPSLKLVSICLSMAFFSFFCGFSVLKKFDQKIMFEL